MNLLIIGGLLAIGLLAMAGSVFLAMGERQERQAPAKETTAPSPSPIHLQQPLYQHSARFSVGGSGTLSGCLIDALSGADDGC